MSTTEPAKRKQSESKEKQKITAACRRRGVLGTRRKYHEGGEEDIKRVHRNIGSLKNLYVLGLEEL